MPEMSRFHWSKDFVEHLRAVHFALVIVSVVLITASTSGLDGRLSKALTQIQQIASLEKQWTLVPGKVIDHALSEEGQDQWDTRMTVVAPLAYLPRRVAYPKIYVGKDILISPDAWKFDERPFPTDMSTLSDFSDFWNDLHAGFILRVPERPTYNSTCVEGVRFTGQDGSVNSIDGTDPAAQGKFFCSFDTGHILSGKSDRRLETKILLYTVPGVKSLNPGAWLEIASLLPASSAQRMHVKSVELVSRVYVSARRYRMTEREFIPIFHKDWKEGDFATAFAELNSAASGVRTLDIGDAVHRIEAEAEASRKDVSILGLNIALSDLSKWGGVLLLSVQLYFWLHLHELANRIEPGAEGWDVAWIGLYTTRLAFLTALVTCSLLPVTAAVCLAVKISILHVYYQKPATAISIVVAVLSALLAVVTYRKLFDLRVAARQSTSKPETDIV
jgi:hypothetical protein